VTSLGSSPDCRPGSPASSTTRRTDSVRLVGVCALLSAAVVEIEALGSAQSEQRPVGFRGGVH
jgi:hypothetical protein